MQRTNLDEGWFFSLDGSPETPVDLPHDFSIGRPRVPSSRMGDKGGFFQGGNGVYKRKFDLPQTLAGGKVILEIEGAYALCEVFVNGSLAAFHPCGYTGFHADLTPWIAFGGENSLEIRVGNDALPNSRWYSGSGLYRSVWLLTGKGAYIEPWGVSVTTPVAEDKRSVVRVETDIAGGGLLRHTLLDAEGRAAAHCEADVSAGRSAQETEVRNARLWDVDSPYLYTLRSELIAGGAVIDAVVTAVGIRSIALDRERGFLLNGKPLKLKGGCVHHDCGILGAAAFPRAEERKVKAMKAAGFNAVRCAHNPPSPAFLDACDRLGLVVMDEAFDCWRMGKTAYDYHLFFEDWWRRDLESMVLRDRNHPSVAFWSTGNEIPERFGASGGYALARALADAVRALDGTRFVANALCGAWDAVVEDWGAATGPFAEPLDIVGYNYLWQQYAEDLERNPGRFIAGTESVAGEAFESWEATFASPRVLGDFVWTGIDYLGESGIGHAYLPGGDARTHGLGYPWHIANCGDLDILCRPRAQSFYRQVLWGHRRAPWIAVHRPNERGLKPEFNFWGWSDAHHSWSWPGCEGYKTYIDVYCASGEAELFLNGRSLGRKPAGRASRHIASFEAPYEPGELKAVAYEGGKPAGEDRVATCGAPAAIRLEADRAEMGASRAEITYVTASVEDRDGNAVPWADNELHFAACGAGGLAAVGTNDPLSAEQYTGGARRAFEGTAVAVLRAGGSPGEIELTVSSEGLKPARITVRVNPLPPSPPNPLPHNVGRTFSSHSERGKDGGRV